MDQAVRTVKWEYRIEKGNISKPIEALLATMGPLGEEGWELISICFLEHAQRLDKATHYLIFKRMVVG